MNFLSLLSSKEYISSSISIITSIHQPNSQTLALFEQLYVLARGGVAIYSGPPGAIQRALEIAISPSAGQKSEDEGVDESPIEALLKLACAGGDAIQSLRDYETSTKRTTQSEEEEEEDGKSWKRKCTAFSTSDLRTHLHREVYLTLIASYRLQLLYVLLYALNYLLVWSVFSATSAAAGCISTNSNSSLSSGCELSFQEEIEFKENAFSLCYTLLYVGLLMIYRSTALFTDNVRSFRSQFTNGKLHITFSLHFHLGDFISCIYIHLL